MLQTPLGSLPATGVPTIQINMDVHSCCQLNVRMCVSRYNECENQPDTVMVDATCSKTCWRPV